MEFGFSLGNSPKRGIYRFGCSHRTDWDFEWIQPRMRLILYYSTELERNRAVAKSTAVAVSSLCQRNVGVYRLAVAVARAYGTEVVTDPTKSPRSVSSAEPTTMVSVALRSAIRVDTFPLATVDAVAASRLATAL
jgi:hypothetical protein